MMSDSPDDHEATWPLERFRAAYDADDNIWWATACGHHQNLFEEACERLDVALARIAAVEALLDDREAAFRGGTRTAAIPSWIGHVREALAKAPE